MAYVPPHMRNRESNGSSGQGGSNQGGSRWGQDSRDDRRGGGNRGWDNRDDRRGGGNRGWDNRDDRRGGNRGWDNRDDRRGGGNRGWDNRDDRRGGGNRGWDNRDDRRGGGNRGWDNRDDRRGGNRGWDNRDDRRGGGNRGWDNRDDRRGGNNRWADSRGNSRGGNNSNYSRDSNDSKDSNDSSGQDQNTQNQNTQDSRSTSTQDSRSSSTQDSRSSSTQDSRFSNLSSQDSRRGGRKKYPTMERDERLESELFSKKTTGIDFDKYDEIHVDVSGQDIPPPIKEFNEGKFHEVLRSNIELAGYVHPTPIQKHGVPIALGARDLMACAQTGSGKTAAFLFPVLSLLLTSDREAPPPRQRGYRREVRPAALILTPTRELALQIYDEARKFTYRTGLQGVAVYGGQSIGDQIRQLNRGCDLVIATPGRLMDMLNRRVMSLAAVQFLILDEADQMLDMGFERDIRTIVLDHDMPEGRQTSMFSATFPTKIQRLAADFLDNHIFLAIGQVGSVGQNITQKVVYVEHKREKDDQLMRVLSESEGRTIVFVETKRAADQIENWLLDQQINAVSIHGDRSQWEREEALANFRSGHCMVLVATSVAARGLDIKDVLLVINYDMPSKFEDYVHRIGRTGRAGHRGNAVAFINQNSRNLQELLDLMRESKQTIEPWFQKLARSSGWGGGRSNNRGKPQRDYRRDNRGGGGGNRNGGGGGGGNWVPGPRKPQFSGYNRGPPTSNDFPSLGGDDDDGGNDAW